MSEKQNAALAARKKGIPIERPKQLTQIAVAKLIGDGVYSVIYDGEGIQKADASSSNPNSTWYAFDIKTASDKIVGEYHVHPRVGPGASYASGNLRLKDDSSFGQYIVGRATDWKWLCDDISKTLT